MKQPRISRLIAVGVIAAAVAVGSAGAAVAGDTNSKPKTPKTAVALAQSSAEFSTLVTAVGAADLATALQGKGPFTVFAPTNAAFAKIPKPTLDGILADKAKLAAILKYHVIAGKIKAKNLKPTQTVNTLNGAPITITVANGKATITDGQGGTSTITATDLKAKNGVVHVIDSVLLPPS